MGMKVLVTGNLGYVGTVLTADLQRHGHLVAGYAAGFFAPCLIVDAAAPDEQLFGDTRSFAEDLRGFDAVVHLAALSNDPLGELDPRLTDDINVGGLRRVAEAAKAAGIRRFVFASSCSLYGKSDGDMPLDETCAQNPLTAYARSKVAGERVLAELTDERFRPIALRFSTAYGWSPRLRLDLVVNNLVASGLASGVIALESDGTPWRPLVHVRDMAQAIRTIATAVAHALGDAPVTMRPASEGGDQRSYSVDFARVRATFPAFAPAWNLERGIAELVANMRGKMDAEIFAGPRYFRIRRIHELLAAGTIDNQLRLLTTR